MTDVTKATRRSRPLLGTVSGFLFGLSLAVLLLVGGVVALDSILLVVLPVAMAFVGLAMGVATPLQRQPK
jgi:hypothetical protein